VLKYIAVLAVFPLMIGLGCTDESPLVPEADLVVMRAYLFAGEPVTEIRLTSSLELGSEDSVAPPVVDADVYLTKDGNRYALQPTAGRPGFYSYPGDDLSVEAGDEFTIESQYLGRVATATTDVPSRPVQIGVFPDQMSVQQLTAGAGRGMFQNDDTTAVQVTWDNPAGESYYVTLENIENDPDPIFELPDGFAKFRPLRFVSIPVNSEEYRITRRSVESFGTHLVKVYRVNQEYVDLYLSRNQDPQDLNEPLTNVTGGLGIFTAFNSDSVFIEVVAQ
jgi:Domain of unknown function (DUF4249)